MNADIENNVRRIFQIKKEVNVSKEHLKYYYLNQVLIFIFRLDL